MPDITIKPSVVGKGITPTMPTEPTAEAKAMVFTNDPVLIGGTDSTTITTDKGLEIKTEAAPIHEEVKTVEAVKEEAKPKQEVTPEKKSVLTPPVEVKTDVKAKTDTKVGETKPAIKPITPVKDKKEDDTFDYSKYTSDQQQVLKQMSNTAKREYAKVVDENKQLAALKDSNYLQHEQGYTLSPEYQQIQQKNH